MFVALGVRLMEIRYARRGFSIDRPPASGGQPPVLGDNRRSASGRVRA